MELTLQCDLTLEDARNEGVAILILLELTLQCVDSISVTTNKPCRNPYFIGINSAIIYTHQNYQFDYVAILILLELTLQFSLNIKLNNMK